MISIRAPSRRSARVTGLPANKHHCGTTSVVLSACCNERSQRPTAVRQRRIARNFKPGRYSWRGKVLEVWFTRDDSSTDIAAEIRKGIVEAYSMGNVFYRRHIDLEAFDSLAPHLNWYNLLGLQDG